MDDDVKYRVIIRRSFRHNGIRYLFQWNLKHHRQFNQRHSRSLWYALSTVAQGRIPLNAFESEAYKRASAFRLKRSKTDDWFVSDLEDRGLLETNLEEERFAEICRAVSTIPPGPRRHFTVQDYLVKNDPSTVAMEVPVWSGFLRLTGHIDLVRLTPRFIEVLDYKPEGRFLYSMPQVALYSYLLASCYPTIDMESIRCVSFNGKKAWGYHPDILRCLAPRLPEGCGVAEMLRRYDMLRGEPNAQRC